jgi:hypothetical protein
LLTNSGNVFFEVSMLWPVKGKNIQFNNFKDRVSEYKLLWLHWQFSYY